MVVTEDVEVFRDPYQGDVFKPTEPLALTEEQQGVYRSINGRLQEQRHGVFLLHGVTGSGKTEVYLVTIQQCINQDRQAIVLVPEIALPHRW